jgi:DNA-directed RNA polymerase specialized sigma24 family protein
MRAVSDAEMASYLPRVERQARRFAGLSGAEFDDLVQEGWEKVFLLLREDLEVSNTAIKNVMRDWLRKCARWYRNQPSSDKMENDAAYIQLDLAEIPHSGQSRVSWEGPDGGPVVAAHPILDMDG